MSARGQTALSHDNVNRNKINVVIGGSLHNVHYSVQFFLSHHFYGTLQFCISCMVSESTNAAGCVIL